MNNFESKGDSLKTMIKVTYHVIHNNLRGWSTFFGTLIISLVNVGLRFIVLLLVAEMVSEPKISELYIDFVRYISAGFILNTLIVIAVESFYDIFRSNYWNGGFDLFASSPLGLKPLIIGGLISRYIIASIYIIALTIIALIMGVNFTISNIISLLCLTLVSLLIAHGIGMIATIEFTYLDQKGGSILVWIFTWLDTLLSGVIIPINMLPPQLAFISNLMPFKYYYTIARNLLFNVEMPYHIIVTNILILSVFATIIFPIGLILLKKGI
ncbi:MAG: ABC transporter permease, partial [archaeon GB-1867-035]|nr:ABC transporter permease [Candidatus Culexmicrobium profundum]